MHPHSGVFPFLWDRRPSILDAAILVEMALAFSLQSLKPSDVIFPHAGVCDSSEVAVGTGKHPPMG